MHISSTERKAKLAALMDGEGYDDLDELLRDVVSDSVSPGICMTKGCGYTTEVEPDQDRGWCEACEKNTVVSALVLAEII